ncbi:MAG: DUF3696 domain-containing protein [Magnetococcus sp. DMHC-6]
MIKNIQLKNFKCFEEISIPLSNLTLMTGLNGMGKSSVIQALLVIRQSFQQDLLQVGSLALNGDLINLGTAQAVLYEDAIRDQLEIDLITDSGVRINIGFVYDIRSDILQQSIHNYVDSQKTNIFLESLFTDHFQYLQAERIGPRVTFPVSENYVYQHRQLGKHGEFTSHFLEIFGRNHKIISTLKHPKEPADELIYQTTAWLGEISPGVAIHLTKHANMDVMNLEYSFLTSIGRSNHYRSSSVGFGITYTLPVIVAILAAPPGSMLILENPEAHLHPMGQVCLGELIALAAAAGVQIILETHSDHILNGIRVTVRQGKCSPEKVAIHFFSKIEINGRTQSRIESPQMDKDGRIDQWPDGFFDVWEKSLEKLL